MERELSTVLRMNNCFITNVESIFKIIFDHTVECLSLLFPQKPAHLLVTVFSLTLAQSAIVSRSHQQMSDFLNYSPRSASDILVEWKSEKKRIFF